MPARRICKYDFTLTGVGTTNVPLNPDGLSRAEALIIHYKLTSAATESNDTLNIYLQETPDNVTWNDRAASGQFLGNMTVSATAPETYEQRLICRGPLDAASTATTEESGEPSGSAGASHRSTGTVKNGPLIGVLRTSAGRGSSHRLQFVVVDPTGANAAFAGTVTIWAVTPDF